MIRTTLIAALLLAPSSLLQADTVYLASGGTLRGEATQLAEPASGYRVVLASGVEISLTNDQVTRVVDDTPAGELYANRVHSVADTVEAQLAMAMWCRDQGLAAEFRLHLQRVVELDPNHEEARTLLAYRKVDGKWLTREQQMAERGLVYYDGRWRTRQDVMLRERQSQVSEQVSDWRSKLKLWRRWLEDRDPARTRQAIDEFNKLEDPMAAEPLVELLKNESNDKIRGMLLAAAARIDHQAAVNVLVVASVEDPNEEIRYQALEYLVGSQRPGLVAPYAKLLKSPENVFVNRAAVALGSIGDKSAMGPLIDALVTEHKKVTGGNSGGGDTMSFSPTAGGFSFGGGGPTVTKYQLRNPDVLSALVRLSGGETFGYEADRWRAWLATQTAAQQVNLRRTR